MKNIIFLLLLLLSGGLHHDCAEFINPTGTYLEKGEIKNSKIIGHSGELRVRLLDSSTIALCFFANKGYPGYESRPMILPVSFILPSICDRRPLRRP
jgi:hypothetical protein